MNITNIISAVCAIGITGIVFLGEAAGRRPVEKPGAEYAVVAETAAECRIAPHPSKLHFDSLDWKVPLGDPYRTQLASGVIAYVAADSSLPLINISAHIRSGSLSDPNGKEGLGALMARLLRTGGTAQYSAEALDSVIDLYAMKFSFSQAEAHIAFSAAFLYEYADTAMNIMKQMFFEPAFQPERIERERSIMTENIRHRFANPGPTLSVAYRRHNYAGSAPARLSTEASLKAITRKDLTALHETAFGSDIIIAVSGKFDRDDMIARLNNIFGTEERPRQNAPFSEMEIAVAPQVRALVVHREINQAYVRMGLPLFMRPHEDFYAVSLLAYILGGGGFNSRLVTRVRSDEGLTYSIHSQAESNYTYPGTLYIEFFTGVESYPRAVSIILEELDKVIKDGVTEEELENARTALIAQLPSSFRSPEDIVSTYAWSEFYGREPDHYAIYPDELRKLTTGDLKNAARKYIDVDKIAYTIVGDTAAIKAAEATSSEFFTLESLGSKLVVTVDELIK